ncbi:MAG: methylmalonyl-CoA mutase subunit beta [Rhodospirillaceae bacterium]|nr:methylmalonyl-CoA mutase subunit beta [Rhodospirillaceae bacterium]
MRGNAPLADHKKSAESVLTLAADFPQAAHDAWLKLVDKVLNGAPFDKKLVSRTYDGIALQPLYTRADWKADGDASGLPGGAPFTRGSRVLGTAVNGWDIRQAHAHPDPATANAEILQDLERGVTSIILKLDPTGANGIAVRTLADLDRALKDVMLDLAPVVLDCAGPPVPYIALLMALLEKRGIKSFTGNFGLDGFAGIAARGKLTAPLETGLKRIADVASYVSRNYPKARAINLTTVVYHSAGASDAQELGCALAAGVEYLRALTGVGTTAGLDIDQAANQIAFTTAVDADMFLSIAKIRALRKLWARVTEACGVAVENRTAPITAQTAPRMMSKRDPWVNMLRTTVASFAAGVAGADAVTVLPFSNAIGLPDDLARRVARNTQVVLQEESSIARVIDPAGGAWMFEKLTDDLSEKAWAFFQEIEKQGGMTKGIMSGFVAGKIAATHAERAKNIARRKDAVTGVSEFPNINETAVAPVKAEAPKGNDTPEGAVNLAAPSNGAMIESLVKAVKSGANVAAMSAPLPQGDAVSITPLPKVRLAEDFEALRDAGDGFKAAYGQRPKIFLANIGNVAQFTGRATFAKNFFEAGGIEAVFGAGGTESAAIVRDFKSSAASFAIVCSTDTVYGEHAASVAKALKEAGAAVVYMAGKPAADAEPALKAAGIDAFIFIGCDAKAVLENAHQRLKAGQ